MKRASTGRLNWALLSTLVLIWALTFAHWIVNVVRGGKAFVELQGVPYGASAYYADLSQSLYAAKTAIYVMLTFVGDTFAAYRCWIVWSKRHCVIILPMLLCVATLCTGFIATAEFSRMKAGDAIFAQSLVPWVTSFIVLSLATNIVCTFLIAFRVIKSQRRVASYRVGGGLLAERITAMLVILVESAGTYSAALICLVTVYLLDSNGQYTILDLTTPIIGITFSMIIVRVALVEHASKAESSRASGTVSWANGRDVEAPSSPRLSRPRRLSVNVVRLVEMSTDRPKSNVKRLPDSLKDNSSRSDL